MFSSQKSKCSSALLLILTIIKSSYFTFCKFSPPPLIPFNRMRDQNAIIFNWEISTFRINLFYQNTPFLSKTWRKPGAKLIRLRLRLRLRMTFRESQPQPQPVPIKQKESDHFRSHSHFVFCGPSWARTGDPLIMSEVKP